MTLVAEVVRSGYVEGTHHGSVLAVRSDGSVALSAGDLTRPVFPRSSNKPLQAIGLLELGWQPASVEQLALATASHSGEPGHVAVVREVLGDLVLGCPAQPPLDESAWYDVIRAGGHPEPITMNCSGKHAAMLRTCAINGWDTASYLSQDSPVQVALRASIERQAGEPVLHVAVDGCGAPQHALTLRGLARAFEGLSGTPVAEAMSSRPWHVGGTGRDVTRLMEGIPGLVAKDGAEGVYAAVLPDVGVVVVKIDDGAARARTPVLVAGLRALGVEAAVLDELAETPVLGGGAVVGCVRALVH